MTQVTVGKWDGNLVLALPEDLVQAIDLQAGERLDIELRHGTITIRRPQPDRSFTDLFRGKSQQEWRAEYAGAYEWGPDVRRQIIPE